MESAENQVARLGRSDCQGDCFQVPHLPDHHDIGILTECRAEGLGERMGIVSQFPLVDNRHLMGVNEFNRIFDGDDVLVTVLVDMVNHGCQRRGLTGTRGTGHQNEAARQLAEILQDGR